MAVWSLASEATHEMTRMSATLMAFLQGLSIVVWQEVLDLQGVAPVHNEHLPAQAPPAFSKGVRAAPWAAPWAWAWAALFLSKEGGRNR